MNDSAKARTEREIPWGHETWRELLALRLYGELAPAEVERLEQHLATCAPCSAFGAELGAGSLAAMTCSCAAEYGLELPADWRERLDAAARPRLAARARPLLIFAAGLAAGLLIMALALGQPRGSLAPASAAPSPDTAETAPVSFATNGLRTLVAQLPAAFLAPVGPPPPSTGRAYAGMRAYLRSE
jgi:hypothetical protein